MFINNTDAID